MQRHDCLNLDGRKYLDLPGEQRHCKNNKTKERHISPDNLKHTHVHTHTHTFFRQGPQLQQDTQPAPQVPLQGGHTHSPLSTALAWSSPCRFRKHDLLRTKLQATIDTIICHLNGNKRACQLSSLQAGLEPGIVILRQASVCNQVMTS
jgi:hypothetical protein